MLDTDQVSNCVPRERVEDIGDGEDMERTVVGVVVAVRVGGCPRVMWLVGMHVSGLLTGMHACVKLTFGVSDYSCILTD